MADLVALVESHFVEDGGDKGAVVGFEVEIGALSETAANARDVRQSDTKTDRVGTGLAALRGSYGGLMMVGIMSKVIIGATAFLNPATLVLGGLLAVRTVKELRKQSLNERRRTTKIDGQKYIGELATLARKDNAERLERIRRQLRDRYQQRAREHQEALSTALATAKADASRSDAERRTRIADIEAELTRLGKLRAVLDAGFAAPIEATEATGAPTT